MVSFKLLSLCVLLLVVGNNGDGDGGDYYGTDDFESEGKPKVKISRFLILNVLVSFNLFYD